MNDTNGNDPAMPTSDKVYGGLTKREYFAGLAMAQLIVRDNFSQNDKEAGEPKRIAIRDAKTAIRYADALIAELSK